MYQCILNVPLWNDWSTVTYSQVHCSPVLKAPSFKSFSWISAKTFAEFIQFWQNPKLRRPRTFEREILVFHWRKVSYLKFSYIFLIFKFRMGYTSKTHIYIYIYMYIYVVFTTEGFFEVAVESWPDWDLNPRPLNFV